MGSHSSGKLDKERPRFHEPNKVDSLDQIFELGSVWASIPNIIFSHTSTSTITLEITVLTEEQFSLWCVTELLKPLGRFAFI